MWTSSSPAHLPSPPEQKRTKHASLSSSIRRTVRRSSINLPRPLAVVSRLKVMIAEPSDAELRVGKQLSFVASHEEVCSARILILRAQRLPGALKACLRSASVTHSCTCGTAGGSTCCCCCCCPAPSEVCGCVVTRPGVRNGLLAADNRPIEAAFFFVLRCDAPPAIGRHGRSDQHPKTCSSKVTAFSRKVAHAALPSKSLHGILGGSAGGGGDGKRGS